MFGDKGVQSTWPQDTIGYKLMINSVVKSVDLQLNFLDKKES